MTVPAELARRIEVIEAGYEYLLAYAAQGRQDDTGSDVRVTLKRATADGIGETIGTVTMRDSSELGLLILPNLKGLPPGAHGFHVHAQPNCSPVSHAGKTEAAGAAGEHLDPNNTDRHAGPVGKGHLGDLPELLVDANGNANMPVVAPHLQVPDVVGHALMVHAGGDNYADRPQPNGGGGERLACGEIQVDSL